MVLVIAKPLRVYSLFRRYTGININREVLFYLVNRCKCTFALILSSLYNIKPDYQNLICLFVKAWWKICFLQIKNNTAACFAVALVAFTHKLLCMAYFWPVDFYAVINHPLDQFLNLQERKIWHETWSEFFKRFTKWTNECSGF